MSGTASKGYQVEVIRTESELEPLRRPWMELLQDLASGRDGGAHPGAGDGTLIFLTWEWAAAWWHNHQSTLEPWLLAARDDEGRLAGIAPWMRVTEHKGPLAVRRITFLHNRGIFANHMDIVARAGERAAVCRAFLAFLRTQQRGDWDVLDLEALRAGSPLVDCLPAAGGVRLEREGLVAPYAPLPESWEAYTSGQLSANRRQQMRSRRRKLEAAYPGQVVFRRVRTGDELPGALDTLVRFNLARWHGKGLNASFDDECFAAAQREFAARALEAGWLRFFLLDVGGQTVAAEYCFRYGDVYVNFQRGFDLAWESYSPGQVLYAYALEQAITEGAREFDMLRGAHDYKLSWTNQTRLDRHIVLSQSWAGHAWLAAEAAFDAAQGAGRKVVPPALRERINLYLGSRHRKGDR